MSEPNIVIPAPADAPPAVENVQAASEAQAAAAISKKRHQWTPEKAALVQRCLDASHTVKETAVLANMSVRSVQRYIFNTRPEDEGQEPRPFIIKPRERQPKDKTTLQQHIRGVLRDQNTATLQDIVDELPGTIQASRSTICREIKKIGWLDTQACEERSSGSKLPEHTREQVQLRPVTS